MKIQLATLCHLIDAGVLILCSFAHCLFPVPLLSYCRPSDRYSISPVPLCSYGNFPRYIFTDISEYVKTCDKGTLTEYPELQRLYKFYIRSSEVAVRSSEYMLDFQYGFLDRISILPSSLLVHVFDLTENRT